MAKVFDFIHATNEVLKENGVEFPLPGQSTTKPEDRAEKGLAVQKQIIGRDTVEKLYNSSPADQMHIQHFLSANCFGDHYTRTGIDVPTRELLTGLTWRMRSAGQGACRREPQRRPRPRSVDL